MRSPAMFNVEIPRLDLNPEDLYEMETYQAYQHAAYIIKTSTPSERVQARLAQYSWSKDVLSLIGIGSVTRNSRRVCAPGFSFPSMALPFLVLAGKYSARFERLAPKQSGCSR